MRETTGRVETNKIFVSDCDVSRSATRPQPTLQYFPVKTVVPLVPEVLPVECSSIYSCTTRFAIHLYLGPTVLTKKGDFTFLVFQVTTVSKSFND